MARCTALSVLLLGASESDGHARLAPDHPTVSVAASTTAGVAPVVANAFGHGEHPVACGRAAFDMDVPGLAVPGFGFDEPGAGTLAKDLVGPLPRDVANADSDFEWSSDEASPALHAWFEHATTSRGFAAGHFDGNLDVSEVHGLASETGLATPVPIGCVQSAIDLGVFSIPEEVGGTEVEIDDVQVRLLDVETVLTVRATTVLDLFVGYNVLELTADGPIDDVKLDADVAIRGLVIGGGLRF
ncbi:MAG TPA: hypothetical protein VF384_01645 [Planctomycetota bacterium]